MSSSTSLRASTSSHEERTAKERRESSVHKVTISNIIQESRYIRRIQMRIPNGETIKFLPGQWLDVHIPGLSKAGGFTITSIPRDAEALPESEHPGFIELAIQSAPQNPPAAWLWRPASEILESELRVRVGGSFVWPPAGVDVKAVQRVVFVAGGVGINPLISILSYLHSNKEMPNQVHFLYTLKDPKPEEATNVKREILFLSRLVDIRESTAQDQLHLSIFLTANRSEPIISNESNLKMVVGRRIGPSDLIAALGEEKGRNGAVCYVCGPSSMTDDLVDLLKMVQGVDPNKVFCEKWW